MQLSPTTVPSTELALTSTELVIDLDPFLI
jgi:hypothetical protein